MKFSILRKEEKNKVKKLTKLIQILSELNPSATFEYHSGEDIYTNLKKNELRNVKLPEGAKFLSDENVSCHYGFIRISYDSENCVIKSECAF